MAVIHELHMQYCVFKLYMRSWFRLVTALRPSSPLGMVIATILLPSHLAFRAIDL